MELLWHFELERGNKTLIKTKCVFENFKIIPISIQKLETQNLTIDELFEILDEVFNNLDDIFKKKLEVCINKNPDIEFIRNPLDKNQVKF